MECTSAGLTDAPSRKIYILTSYPYNKLIFIISSIIYLPLAFTGQIDCPDPAEFCDLFVHQKCKYNCFGKGTCLSDLTCDCDIGWEGDYCSIAVRIHINILRVFLFFKM